MTNDAPHCYSSPIQPRKPTQSPSPSMVTRVHQIPRAVPQQSLDSNRRLTFPVLNRIPFQLSLKLFPLSRSPFVEANYPQIVTSRRSCTLTPMR
ncbi:hypothetical protein HOLleu_33588 [Holothuria leucospilota]|uniref:Uncharacterized protein n=1 Tax=Holothuria leucospilota TaxID=206669 RepID=A0A9Q0YQZ2_HOLLE|nr:hypothetical protein HOLleu_33588 [Holothuria leucospilota]